MTIIDFLNNKVSQDGWDYVSDYLSEAVSEFGYETVGVAVENHSEYGEWWYEYVEHHKRRKERQKKNNDRLERAEKTWETSLHKMYADGYFQIIQFENKYLRGKKSDTGHSQLKQGLTTSKFTEEESVTEIIDVVEFDGCLYRCEDFLTKEKFLDQFERYSVGITPFKTL